MRLIRVRNSKHLSEKIVLNADECTEKDMKVIKPQSAWVGEPGNESGALTKKQRQLAMAVEQSAESIVITDIEGRIAPSCNGARQAT